jgi:hypothetical protein
LVVAMGIWVALCLPPRSRGAAPEGEPTSPSPPAVAPPAETQPAETKPAETSPAPTQPATTQAAVDPAVKRILDHVEKAGRKYKTLEADVNHKFVELLTGDMETRTGSVIFQRGHGDKPTTFRIQFETLKQGPKGRAIPDRLVYAFDGRWLSILKYRSKQMTRVQVAAKGERLEPMRLGKGPFPVPFGQKTADVLEHFEVTTRKPGDGDPKNSEYLRLLTRPAHRKELVFLLLEVWVDRKTHLPVQIISHEGKRLRRITKRTTVVFSNVKTDRTFKDEVFHPARPGPGWTLRVEPLKKAES